MIQLSDKCLPESVSILKNIFTFEPQSEFSASMIHYIGHFWSFGFGVMNLLKCKTLRNT